MKKSKQIKRITNEGTPDNSLSLPTHDSQSATKLRQVEWGVAVLATAIAIYLHLHFWSCSSALWRDEINSVNLASMPSLSQMWQFMEFDSFPMLWTLMLRGWIAIGVGDVGLRLFGLLGGLTILAAIWFTSLKLSRNVPIASLALIAVNPEIIRWGASVRAWGLAAALAVTSLVFLQKVLKSPTKLNISLAAFVGILSVQCAYQNSLILAASIVGMIFPLLIRREWKPTLIFMGIGVVSAISLLPYLPIISRAGEWNMLVQSNFTLSVFTRKILEVINSSGTLVLACWLLLVVAAIIVVIRSVAVNGLRTTNVDKDLAVSATAIIVTAISGLAVFYLRLGYSTKPWYYIGLLVLIALSAEVAIVSSLRTKVMRVLLVIFALIVLIAGTRPALESLSVPQTNLNVIAERLTYDVEEGDIIIVTPWYFVMTFDHYYRGTSEITTIPPLDDRKLHRYDLVKRAMFGDDPTSVIVARIQKSLESGHKAWIVGGVFIPPAGTELHPLPKPPLSGTGWSESPYLELWTLEIGAFLRDHALSSRMIPIDSPEGRYETADLAIVQGWRK